MKGIDRRNGLHGGGGAMEGVIARGTMLLGLLAMMAGCGGKMTFAQVPPTTWQIVYTWTAPQPTAGWAGCGQPACAYVLSTLAVPATTAACPQPSSSVVYTPVNQAAPTGNLNYTYLGAASGGICAVVQTVQSGAYSPPSAPSNVVVVPSAPGGPSTPSATLGVESALLKSSPNRRGNELALAGRAVAKR